MNVNLKKKRSLFAIAFLCLVVLVGITIAYFTSTSNIENIFNAGTYKTVTTEEFISPSNWAPGDETPKTVTTKNEGTIPVRVRVKLDESWTSKNNNELPLTYNNENVAIINLDNEVDWILKDGYYYYTKELAPGESTTSLIKSVTFNPNVPSDVSCSNDGGVYTCESTGDGYDGAQYKLNITTETVQANKYEEIWENIPIMYNYVGEHPCTFEGELIPGAEYVNGQYTYKYKKGANVTDDWLDLSDDGWGVMLTDKNSVDPVTSVLCSSINNKPITSMGAMFYNSNTTSIDLSSFDTSNVTDMWSMFQGNQATVLDLSTFDTSKVRDMSYMFAESQVTTLDLSNFDTSNVFDMQRMFDFCQATSIDLNSFDTSNVFDMRGMFAFCQATSIDLSSFDTSNITDMSYMFSNCEATSIDLSSFDTSKVTDMSYMFEYTKVVEFDLHNFDTSNVVNMSYMFDDCEATSFNLSSFSSEKLVNASSMLSCFYSENIDLRNFDLTTLSDVSGIISSSNTLQSLRLKNRASVDVLLNSNVYCNPFDIYVGNSTTPEIVNFPLAC